ncbi:MAG: AraC family transcriptional regulator [Eubacterium sp.]|nr:AraC family transcriptional regulator [Eubacterium sp.]
MENYTLYGEFTMGCLHVSPVHVRLQQLPPVIAAHSHSNESYEIHYAAAGNGTVDIEGKPFEVHPGTIYITGPGVVHTQRSEPGAPVTEYGIYLNCRKTDSDVTGKFALFADTIFWFGTDSGRIFPLMKELLEENRNPMPDTEDLAEILLRQVILRLTRMYRGDNGTAALRYTAPFMTREGLIPVLEDAFLYRYKDLNITDLSELLHLSVRQTQRLLQERFGKTFSQKRTEARMAAASQLLKDTQLTVTAISEQIGFSNIEHFSAAFRRETGYTPREYRKKFHL